MEEIVSCHATTGEYDLLPLRLNATALSALTPAITPTSRIRGVERSQVTD
jgi:hypothetical protein